MIEGRLRLLQVLLGQSTFLSRSQIAFDFAEAAQVEYSIKDARRQALSDFDANVRKFVSGQPANEEWLAKEILPLRNTIDEQWSSVLEKAKAPFYSVVTEDEVSLPFSLYSSFCSVAQLTISSPIHIAQDYHQVARFRKLFPLVHVRTVLQDICS
jgi:hypothetical protein